MTFKTKKLGLIVNPIAGMGGSVGLKGTDGEAILRKAIELGATPLAPSRTIEALREITQSKNDFELISCPHEMGETEASACGFNPTIIGSMKTGNSTPRDTRDCAAQMLTLGVDLMLLAGGDGTARDVYDAIGDRLPVLGIPTGVKMYSAIFAISPRIAGKLAMRFLQGQVSICKGEVMDVDTSAFGRNVISATLHGYLSVPCERLMVQSAKNGGTTTEREALQEIASYVVDNMENGIIYIIGPGTTTKSIMDKLTLNSALLGVDAVRNRELIASDANEAELLALTKDKKAKIIVTVIGGQGFIFGRGNQQISPKLIDRVGTDNIIVVAAQNKIASLRGRPLLVDTGSSEIDDKLRGYIKVITGYARAVVYRVA
jgi:predicted polyphosphate/ATP-dependent NAD kinase